MSELLDRRVSEAREEVQQVRDWLMRPSSETMEACTPALERAVGHIRELSSYVQPPKFNFQVIEALTALAGEIQTVQALLASAGELHCGRMRRLAMLNTVETRTSPSISVTG
jgi:hypothetical protein